MVLTKGAHQSANFQIFDCSSEISPNLHFNRFLLLKVSKISAKKVRGVIIHETEEWCKIWRKQKQFVVLKLTRNWWILIQTLKSLKNLHFDWSLSCKLCNVWSKKVQRSYLSWHWKVMQNLKKNGLVVWKMTWGIWQIFTRTLESVKISNFMGSFCPK